MAHNLGGAVGIFAGDDITREATTLRRRLFTTPGRLVHSARRLRLPCNWPWEHGFSNAVTKIAAIPAPT